MGLQGILKTPSQRNYYAFTVKGAGYSDNFISLYINFIWRFI